MLDLHVHVELGRVKAPVLYSQVVKRERKYVAVE